MFYVGQNQKVLVILLLSTEKINDPQIIANNFNDFFINPINKFR